MNSVKSKIINGYRFPIILLISMILGSIVGIIFKESSAFLKPFGDIFLNLMYTIVVPLVFFTISSSIANMVNLKRLGKILKTVFIVFVITSVIAAIFMTLVVLFIDPVGGARIEIVDGTKTTVDVASKIVAAITVSDFGNLLSRSNMMPLIFFSIIFGLSVSLVGKSGNHVAKMLDNLSKVMMKVVEVIMYYAPIGIFAYFANLIGEFGPELLGSYARSMVIYYVCTVIFFLVFYTLYAYIAGGKLGIKKFYQNVLPPFLTSLATQSSLATLPTNLDATEKIGVPKDIREVTLPIGTTMHMEGSSMGAILKIAFLFSVFNYSFNGLDTILIAILIALLSSVVMSGIPGGGLIGEMLIVSLYGFPASAFPLIATIGWLIDPPATMLNVVGDTASSMLVTKKIDGKNWLTN
ncbi:MAG: dicarboxylate/amino acid:cation symporter [Bacilli bacterium]|nr:dicarboxylate/amino acid:cation symporter [Bacilli bacterium]MDD4733505.1 dicarboxylate/amino acid:cation symporter [Bacilli bacterium]